MLCSHRLPSQYILFCKFFFLCYNFCTRFFFFNSSFSLRWFSCLQPSCPPSEFVLSLREAHVYCMSSWGHTVFHSVDIHEHGLLPLIFHQRCSKICPYLTYALLSQSADSRKQYQPCKDTYLQIKAQVTSFHIFS